VGPGRRTGEGLEFGGRGGGVSDSARGGRTPKMVRRLRGARDRNCGERSVAMVGDEYSGSRQWIASEVATG